MGDYSPHEHKPLVGYAALTAAFNGAAAAYRRSERELPDELPVGDFVLMAAATQKLRLVLPSVARRRVLKPSTRTGRGTLYVP